MLLSNGTGALLAVHHNQVAAVICLVSGQTHLIAEIDAGRETLVMREWQDDDQIKLQSCKSLLSELKSRSMDGFYSKLLEEEWEALESGKGKAELGRTRMDYMQSQRCGHNRGCSQ